MTVEILKILLLFCGQQSSNYVHKTCLRQKVACVEHQMLTVPQMTDEEVVLKCLVEDG